MQSRGRRRPAGLGVVLVWCSFSVDFLVSHQRDHAQSVVLHASRITVRMHHAINARGSGALSRHY